LGYVSGYVSGDVHGDYAVLLTRFELGSEAADQIADDLAVFGPRRNHSLVG
jgi:hypothetical protein